MRCMLIIGKLQISNIRDGRASGMPGNVPTTRQRIGRVDTTTKQPSIFHQDVTIIPRGGMTNTWPHVFLLLGAMGRNHAN